MKTANKVTMLEPVLISVTAEYMGHEIALKRSEEDFWMVAIDGDVDIVDGDFLTMAEALSAAACSIDDKNEDNGRSL